ncbi:hypothetical protein BM523_15900 [Alteromonas mediterranea]|nr:hypothetical protein BM523_15900 [Alteromonas mediterranea]
MLSAPEKNNGVRVHYSPLLPQQSFKKGSEYFITLNIRTGYTFIASADKSEKCTLTPLLLAGYYSKSSATKSVAILHHQTRLTAGFLLSASSFSLYY